MTQWRPQGGSHFSRRWSSWISKPFLAKASRAHRPSLGSCPMPATRNLPLRANCKEFTKPLAGRQPSSCKTLPTFPSATCQSLITPSPAPEACSHHQLCMHLNLTICPSTASAVQTQIHQILFKTSRLYTSHARHLLMYSEYSCTAYLLQHFNVKQPATDL